MKSLSSPLFLTLKTGFATAVALLIDMLIRNPDHVTSTFLAVLTTSPSVSLGLARGIESYYAATVGAVFGFFPLLFRFSPILAVPLSVPPSVLVMVLTGYEYLFGVAAFSALYVSLVEFDNPYNTLFVRFKSISSGVLAASLINILISAWQYKKIFSRKIEIVRSNIINNLEMILTISRENPLGASPLFAQIEDLSRTLARARFEARYLCPRHVLDYLKSLTIELSTLQNLLHLLVDISYFLHFDSPSTPEEREQILTNVISWIRNQSKDEFEFPMELMSQYERLRPTLSVVRRRLSVVDLPLTSLSNSISF
ncbi:hypothetical protein GEMRC1_006233 [Eukaryota sp. GEM-RC1]